MSPRIPTAFPTEVVWMRWVMPTSRMALEMAKRLEDWLRAAKVRSPEYPGWYVRPIVTASNCTVLVRLCVEPEAIMPQA